MANQANISHQVLDIVAAFTSVRDVMRKLRSRRVKNKKAGEAQRTLSGGELRLNESLRRGPLEIEEQYAQGLRVFGNLYSHGDQHACTDMATILMRLNYGIVHIISDFLRSPEGSKVGLDYQALTSLSEISSLQARNSLTALGQRLATSRPHQILSSSPGDAEDHTEETGKIRRRHKGRTEGQEYFSVSKLKNETQIALIRPVRKAKRTMSTKSRKTSTWDCRVAEERNTGKKAPIKSARKAVLTTNAQARSSGATQKDKIRIVEEQRVVAVSSASSPTFLPDTFAKPAQPYHISKPEQVSSSSLEQYPPLHDLRLAKDTATLQARPQAAKSAIPRRRADINTESIYTMASASTKLGEIPMHRWPQPFDYEAAARQNAEAKTANWVSSQVVSRPKKSPGLLKRLFKG